MKKRYLVLSLSVLAGVAVMMFAMASLLPTAGQATLPKLRTAKELGHWSGRWGDFKKPVPIF